MCAALGLVLLIAAAPAAWRPIAPGAEHLRVDEDGLHVELLRFDLVRFRAQVVVLGADGARTAAALRDERAVAAVINGGFFDQQWRSLGLRISAGKTVIPLRPRVDWGVLVMRGARATIVHSRDFHPEPAVEEALQVGPRLVAAGQPLKLKPQLARRTAVALDKEGRTLTLAVTTLPVEAQRLADALAQLGFDAALMFDGGPSSQLAAAVGELRLDLRGAYAVPDVLVIRAR
jgi:uncharacterized protein YigE (DUF2233 family)